MLSVIFKTATVVLALLAFVSNAAVAAPSADEQQRIIRQQQQLLRQDEERRQELERQRKLRELAPPSEPEAEPKKAPLPQEGCVEIERIVLSPNDVLKTKDLAAELSPFENQCLSTNDIQLLLATINDAFRDSGYITTRAYLQQQDLSDKVLEITIIEGRIEGIHLDDDTPDKRSQITFAFPNKPGDILNIRDIEQGLDQINRLASNNAKMQVSPGAETGTSNIDVTNDPTNRVRVTFGRDNSGSSSTGKLQNSASLSIDNLLSINDGWIINYSKTARDYGADRLGESFSGVFSIPIGYSILTYSGSYYRYSTLVSGNTQDFMTSGLSRSHKVELSRVIHRDQTSKSRLDLSVTAKQSRNYIEDVFVETSSRKLTVGRAAFAHSTRLFDGIGSIEIGAEHGLKILGALKDSPDQDSDAPKAQFLKYTLETNYQKPFQLFSENFSLSTASNWQYTPDTLYGTERIGVGGQYSVRGFRDDTLSGDVGGYIRNEIAWNPDISTLGIPTSFISTVQPYGAFDWGWIKRDNSETRERGTLSGVAFGLRAAGKFFSLSAEYAHGLSSPDFLEKRGREINFRAVFML
ncbi:ShlB/FhaC/HecB family hemolysin secretion/activation protein [Thalassospira sp. MA62]|nr:ShlB/FhaC/HecB family hemolysin secretion/activation protein [Thalassospira sp. MA62]